MSIKGSFVWGKNLKPDYVWFNGTASHYLIGDTVDPSQPLKINELYGQLRRSGCEDHSGEDPSRTNRSTTRRISI